MLPFSESPDGVKLKATATRTSVPALGSGIQVAVHATGRALARTHVYSFWLKPGQAKLADRLCRAVEAHKAVVPRAIRKDSAGDTYLDCDVLVLGRTMNADLKMLGF